MIDVPVYAEPLLVIVKSPSRRGEHSVDGWGARSGPKGRDASKKFGRLADETRRDERRLCLLGYLGVAIDLVAILVYAMSGWPRRFGGSLERLGRRHKSAHSGGPSCPSCPTYSSYSSRIRQIAFDAGRTENYTAA